ncbi:hypothetical protein ED733_004010 [Metarhizium rileyi]|uniref:Uncharacterized protein n=1 Tax=Metarhizium rileyi (strain RCEF 4871) TaxID=1649241 RepID=A0A5C6GG22_METRR|nr:hypothetical protein ED733_004010 [Metarhizium rileyi]
MSEVLDLRKDTILNAKVTEAKYDKKANHWTLTTSAGHEASARHVIFVTGTSNKTSFSGEEMEENKNTYQALFAQGKYNSDTGFPYNFEKRSFYDLSPKERE